MDNVVNGDITALSEAYWRILSLKAEGRSRDYILNMYTRCLRYTDMNSSEANKIYEHIIMLLQTVYKD